MPIGAPTFSEALRAGAEIFHALARELHERRPRHRPGRRGRLRAVAGLNQAAIEVVLKAIERAGYNPARMSRSRSTRPSPSWSTSTTPTRRTAS